MPDDPHPLGTLRRALGHDDIDRALASDTSPAAAGLWAGRPLNE